MIIISIVLIYLSLINICLCKKELKRSLGFKKWSQYFFSLFILLSFFFFFIFFLRILSFFREMKVLDLKYFFFNYDIKLFLFFFIFFYSLRKLIFLKTKISFFRIHYFYLAPENNSHYEIYYKFYVFGIYNFCVKYYKYFFWLNRLMFMFLVFFFVKDCVSYDFVLNDCLYFMKFYSLFKVFYIMLSFVALKQELMLDYYLFNLFYKQSVSLDEGFFAETVSKRCGEIDKYENDIIKS